MRVELTTTSCGASDRLSSPARPSTSRAARPPGSRTARELRHSCGSRVYVDDGTVQLNEHRIRVTEGRGPSCFSRIVAWGRASLGPRKLVPSLLPPTAPPGTVLPAEPRGGFCPPRRRRVGTGATQVAVPNRSASVGNAIRARQRRHLVGSTAPQLGRHQHHQFPSRWRSYRTDRNSAPSTGMSPSTGPHASTSDRCGQPGHGERLPLAHLHGGRHVALGQRRDREALVASRCG